MRGFFVAVLFVLFVQPFLSQTTSVLEEQKLAVDTLFFSNQKAALSISEEMLPIAFSSGDTNYITYFLDQAGELNRLAGNYDKAIDQLYKCLSYKQNWEDLKDLSLTHNNLGKTYTQKGQYDLATHHFFEALMLMEEAENLLGQSFYLNNIAAVFDLQHNYKKALDYYQQSLSIKGQLGDEKGMAASYTNIGITYFNLGDLEQAADFHQKAYHIYTKVQDTTKASRAANNLARTYIELEDYPLAREVLLTSRSLLPHIYDEKLKMDILNNSGLYFLKVDQVDSAEMCIQLAMNMAEKTQSFGMLKTSHQIYAELLLYKNQPNEAYQHLLKSIAYNDSLINETNIYAIADIQGKYEYERQQNEIIEGKLAISQKEKMIETQRANLTLWIGVAIVALIFVVLFIILYLNKQQNSLLLKGQLALLSTRKEQLENLNESIKKQLDKTKISLEEKEDLLENVFSSAKEKVLPPELLGLSKREMEVLSYLALGWTDEQLAEKLFVSKSTIKTHLRRIYSKLLVRGRAEAVAIAHRHNLIGDIS